VEFGNNKSKNTKNPEFFIYSNFKYINKSTWFANFDQFSPWPEDETDNTRSTCKNSRIVLGFIVKQLIYKM